MKRKVSVLMPVYNAEQYLNEAIDSLLSQSFSDFELLAINDGSTDKSEEIILSYADERVRYVKNEKNLGLVATLNKGLELIDTEYIIRMDADDISVPNRFEILVKYMENNPETGVYSSALERFGDEVAIWKTPVENDAIKAGLLFGSSIGHAPCIMRTSLVKRHNIRYRDVHPHMEDYDLWFRIKDLTRFAATHEVLYRYRVANHNVTVTNSVTIIERKKKIFKWILGHLNIDPTDEELLMHAGFGTRTLPATAVNIRKYKTWLEKLETANRQTTVFPQQALAALLKEKWNRLFFILPGTGFKNVWTYIRLSRGLTYPQALYLFKVILNTTVFRKKLPQ